MKSKLSKVSTDKLIAELNKRVATKLTEINDFRSKIEGAISFSPTKSTTPTKTQTVKKSKKMRRVSSSSQEDANNNAQQPLSTFISEILSTHPDGMTIKDIVSDLEKTEWHTTSAKKYSIVAVALAGNKEKFEKVARGVYKLRINNQ